MPSTLRTDRNIIGRQQTTEVEEVVTAIRILTDCVKSWTIVLPDAFTEAQLNSLFAMAPTVTGTKVITASGCAGYAATDAGERAVLTNKGYTLN